MRTPTGNDDHDPDDPGTPSDELLMAYADGELPADEAAAIERAIAASPALADRVEMFRATRLEVRGAFAALADEAAPDALVRAILAGNGSGEAPAAPRRLRHDARWWPTALAASFAAIVAGTLGFLAAPERGRPADATAALATLGDDLARVLGELPDGGSRRLERGGGMAAVDGTYRLPDQRICRVITLDHEASATTAQGLACRVTDGWRIEAAMAGRPAGQFRPAAAGPSIADLLDAAGAGEELPAGEVERLIRDGWR